MKLTATQIRQLSLLEAMIDCFKDTIKFIDVRRGLPFGTSLWEGSSKTHIVSEHAFDIPLYNQDRAIHEGETLCGRYGILSLACNDLPSCPGCLTIGQGLIARDWMKQFPVEYFEQKRKMKK